MRSRPIMIALLALLTALPAPATAQDRPLVIASSSILADVIANVAGDAAEVAALIPLAADPHAYTPAPQDLVALAGADVVFVVGANYEENLNASLESIADELTIVTASLCVDILSFGESGAGESDHADDAAPAKADEAIAAQCAAHHAELAPLTGREAAESDSGTIGMLYSLACGGADLAGEDAHAPGSCDPHVWTDPYNGMLWALMARDSLSALDPDNADRYATNAAAYVVELQALVTDDLLPMLDSIPTASRKLVTNHIAFNYFARAFGFETVGAILPGASTLAEPSAADLARLIEAIRAAGVPAIFAETTTNPALAAQIAQETGVTLSILYTGSLSAPDGPASTYLDYLRHNTLVIAEALTEPEGCTPCAMHRP
jgi:ABC-type Zn uptake system ZnuABC Zn-binding protein ZnuA